MAALRNGIGTVIIPADNVSDLTEIDQQVRCGLHFIPAAHVDDILDVVLLPVQTGETAVLSGVQCEQRRSVRQ